MAAQLESFRGGFIRHCYMCAHDFVLFSLLLPFLLLIVIYFIWRSLLPGHGALVPDCSDRTMDGRKRFNLVKIVHNGKFIERFASDKRFAARMNRYRSKPFANQFAGESFQMR